MSVRTSAAYVCFRVDTATVSPEQFHRNVTFPELNDRLFPKDTPESPVSAAAR